MKKEGSGIRGWDMMMEAGAAVMEFLPWKMEEGHEPRNKGSLWKQGRQGSRFSPAARNEHSFASTLVIAQ